MLIRLVASEFRVKTHFGTVLVVFNSFPNHKKTPTQILFLNSQFRDIVTGNIQLIYVASNAICKLAGIVRCNNAALALCCNH